MDEDVEIAEEPIDEEDVLALDGPDSWDIKKNPPSVWAPKKNRGA